MKKLIITISILFLAAACNQSQVQPVQNQPVQNQSTNQPAPTSQTQPQAQKQSQATSTDPTISWATFKSNFGYQLKYPDGWTIQDLSFAYNGNNSIGFWIFGPKRSGLPGATGQAFFAEQGCYNVVQLKFTDYCDQNQGEVILFNYPQKSGEQAVNSVSLDESYIKSTPEYQTARIILNSATLQSNQISNWQIYNNTDYGFEVSYPSDWSVTVAQGQGNPIIVGFYFGPKGGFRKADGSLSQANWDIQIFNKVTATPTELSAHPGSTQYENNGKIYVISNEGLQPQLFNQFLTSFKFTK